MKVIFLLACLGVAVLARPEAGFPFRTITHMYNGRGDEFFRGAFQALRPNKGGPRNVRGSAPRGSQASTMYGPPGYVPPAPIQSFGGHSLDLPTEVSFGSPVATGGEASYFKGGPAPVPAFNPAPAPVHAPVQTYSAAPAPISAFNPAPAPVHAPVSAYSAAPAPVPAFNSAPAPVYAPVYSYSFPAPAHAPVPAFNSASAPVHVPVHSYSAAPAVVPAFDHAPAQPCHTSAAADYASNSAATTNVGSTMFEVVHSVPSLVLENTITSGLMGYTASAPAMMLADTQPRIVTHGGHAGYPSFSQAVQPVAVAGPPTAAPVPVGAPIASASFASDAQDHGSSAIAGSESETTTVHKHLYVHVAPEETIEAEPALGGRAPAAPAQKHYKIIFIKAPSFGQQLAQQQAAIAASQTESKTLVYVLSKKPDDLVADSVTGEAGPAFTPMKPEVYFIKYKANEVVGNAVPAGGSGSTTVTANSGPSLDAGGIGDFNLPKYPSVYGVPS